MFENESFDVIVDKGGLDALMEPEHGSKLGNLYLSEVRRLLKAGGKFICLTLAEAHVLGFWPYSLSEALQREKKFRSEHSSGSDILYLLEDLKLGARGDLSEFDPGRRVKLTLGEPGVSYFSYRAVLLDAQRDAGPFSFNFGVFLVPKIRAYEWLFSSAEGQWVVVASSKAALLLMLYWILAKLVLPWRIYRWIFLL